MVVSGSYLCALLLFLITFADHTWAYLDQPDLSKRFDGKLLEPGLPWVLEKRRQRLEPELAYSDATWDSDGGDLLEQQIAWSMEQRARRELELTRRALNGEAVPYEPLPALFDMDQATIPRRVTRDANPAPQSTPNGLRAQLHWKPIAIGSLCAVCGVLMLLGAVIYYQKIYLPEKQAEAREAEGGHEFVDHKSSQESLLGETMSLSLDGDRKLAHSAQMYHYQHQKQQMLAVERASDHAQASEESNGSDVDEGDFTVYECPGLAEPHQLELENPLFEGDSVFQTTNTTDLDDESDSTPTAKTMDH